MLNWRPGEYIRHVSIRLGSRVHFAQPRPQVSSACEAAARSDYPSKAASTAQSLDIASTTATMLVGAISPHALVPHADHYP